MKKILLFVLVFNGLLFSKEYMLDLDKAIDMALENNTLNRISKLNLDVAKAQYEQALSANYPSIDAMLYANRAKEDGIFQQRGNFTITPQNMKDLVLAMDPTQAATIGNIPAEYLFSSSEISADVDSVIVGRDTAVAQLEINYPLYTGGKISAIIEQARLNKDIKREAVIRERTNVIYDVKKYFYGYILTNELYNLVNSIYKNMEFSRDLTKEFLENGTDLKINKTDYLNIKLLTSMIKSTLSTIKLNREMLKGALGNSIGLKYDDTLNIEYDEQKILKQNATLEELVKKASTLNHDINTINLAIKVKDEQINEANSEYYPMVNLFGNVSHTYNSYEYGFLNEDQDNRWNIGIAVKMSLFNGFKTKNTVLEKKLDRKIIDEQKILLEDGIGLQLKNEFLKSSIGYDQVQTLKEAVETASENSEMNFKGYQYEMVEAKDLVQSQLMEVYSKSLYLKSVHDYLLSLATIDKLVGNEVDERY